MKRLARLFFGLAVFVSLFVLLSPPASQAQYFARTPAYEVFGDPTADFFIHGYTDLTYWDYEKDHILPLQFLTAQDAHGQFSNYFTALFVGSNISDSLSMLTQIHFHLNPIPGQVGPTVVIPQAKVTWLPLMSENVKLHFGRFYSPFGITNDDVQTPLNRFVSPPYTGYTAIPFHWFDTGIQLDLAGGLTDTIGGNLTVAFTNGPQRIVADVPPNFDALDNFVLMPPSAPGGALLKTSYSDLGNNVALRAGLFPGLPGLEIGASYTTGTLREVPLIKHDPTPEAGMMPMLPSAKKVPGQFPAEWDAVGVDLQLLIGRLSLRADWTRSTEELTGPNSLGDLPPADEDEIEREAWRVQAAVHVLKNVDAVIRDAWLTFRFDQRDPDKDFDDNSDLRRYTVGINLAPHSQVMFKLNYEIVDEVDGADLDNDGVLAQVVANF